MGIKEISLSETIRKELEECTEEGLQLLSLDKNSTPFQRVEAVNEFIDKWQDDQKDEAEMDATNISLALGAVWGDAICEEFGWEWTAIDYQDNTFYVVCPSNRCYACYPTYDVLELLRNPENDNCALLIFNLIKGEVVPESEPNEFMSLGFGGAT